MLNTIEYADAMVDIVEMLKLMDDVFIEKIPADFIKMLNEKKSKTYISTIDFTKPLSENNLSYETKVILTHIYREYLCTPEEKKELNDMLEENESIQYKTDIFDKPELGTDREKSLIVSQDDRNFFQKIIGKLFKRDKSF